MAVSASATKEATAREMPREPVLRRDENGAADYDSVPDVIEWFLNFDQRVATVKHPKVEELFQWKQNQSRLADENVFIFNCAEDRDRKSTRLNSSHTVISYAVFCLKKKKITLHQHVL